MNEERSVITPRFAGIRLMGWCRRLSQRTCAALKGHPLAWLSLGVSLVVGVPALALLSQRSSAAAPSDQLTAGISIYQQGEFRLAQAVFGQIAPGDPVYGIAQAYDALCRYELCRAVGTNDYHWFLSALESAALQSADLPGELREELAFKEIDALYHSGQFEDRPGFSKAIAFLKHYPASPYKAAAREYELAARLDRGMAEIYKACTTDRKGFEKSWTNGVGHLERFLSRVGVFRVDEYAVLKDRALAEDLQVALAVLGREPTALGEIGIGSPERLERYGFIRVGLHLKLNPTAWEQNLELLSDFEAQLQTFPESSRRGRVEYDLARFAFRTGEELYQENAGAVPGEAAAVEAKAGWARRYFETVRGLQGRAAQGQWFDDDMAHREWLPLASLASYFYEQDYAGLSAAAEAQLAQSSPGSVDWVRAKVFSGLALYRQSPAQREAAVTIFEEVLGLGFRNQHEHDDLVLEATGWRIQVALMAGDQDKVRALFDWVRQAPCAASARDGFLRERREYAALVGWTEPK